MLLQMRIIWPFSLSRLQERKLVQIPDYSQIKIDNFPFLIHIMTNMYDEKLQAKIKQLNEQVKEQNEGPTNPQFNAQLKEYRQQ